MRKWIKTVLVLGLVISFTTAPKPAKAIWWVVIKAAIKKAIRAADLAIQKQQNKVIWLQNAQKALENTMSKLKLKEIGEWTDRQRILYKKYFEELGKVKAIIAYYQRIRDITRTQLALVREYRRAWNVIRQDKHFTAQELMAMARVYEGILAETVRNIDELGIIVNSFKTKMSDASRIELIDKVADRVDENYTDLTKYNSQNALESLKRAKAEGEIEQVKKMYGLK